MKVTTVSELLEMSDGTVPEAIRGKVTKVFPAKKAPPGSAKDWKMQKIQLTDNGVSIECVLDNRAQDMTRSAEGTMLYAVASRNSKGGLSGLKRRDNDYQNKITPQIWIYDSAELSTDGADAPQAQGQPPAQQPRQQPPPARQQSDSNRAASSSVPTNGNGQQATNGEGDATAAAMKVFNRRLSRNVSAMNRCFDATLAMVDAIAERHPGRFQPSNSDIKELAVTLFIQSGWVEKPGEIDGFPIREFQHYAKPAPTNGNGTNGNGTNGHATNGNGRASAPNGNGNGRTGEPFN